MSWDHVSKNWKEAGDRIKVTWGKLSEADIAAIDGNREKLSALLQERYRLSETKVNEMISYFAERLKTGRTDH